MISIALLLLLPRGNAADEAPLISVGIAVRDITPDYAVRLSGFGGRRTESEGVTMKLWAKALAFNDEREGPAILIAADNLCVPDEITKEVARRLGEKIGLKLERFTITATHTHTGPMLKNVCPTLFGVPIPPEHQVNIDRYTREFTGHLEAVALAAFKDIRPGRISFGIGQAGFAVNRRTKGGPVDHDLPVLAVHDPEGKVRAIYFSYACHCVTLSDNKISGDWAGFAQHRIEEAFPGAIALASVGCGADLNPSSGVTGSNVQVCDDQGREIANEIKRLINAGLKPVRATPSPRYARLDLPLAEPRTRAEWETRAKRQDAVGHHARVNLERLDRGEELPTKINYPIQTWVFGDDLAMVFLPGETVVDYSLRLKREYDRSRLWVNGYSNDGRCYIPSERILKEGGYEGGEAMIYYDFPQFFAPGLEQKIINTVAAQLPPSFKAAPGTEGTRPLSAADALRTFKTKRGLKVELVAAEPLVQDPIAIDWGADGTLWVCEMHDYPSGTDMNWQPGGRVKSLKDTDGDGRHDAAIVFLDGLPFPTGVTAWGRGLLICAAPDILYAEDTNGDGKADKVEKLYTGFFTDNFQARVNSLSLGLDNYIYAANGLLGGTIESLRNSIFREGSRQPLNIRNHDFRIHPASGALELVSGLTQQGRVRDDFGNWFGCDNSHLLLSYPVPLHYIRRNPHTPAPDPIRRLASGPDGNRLFPASRLLERFNDPGHANRVTSACGLGIYRDTHLGDEFYGNAFTCEPVHNVVHREVLKRGLAFTSQRADDEQESEFLASTDNWFRPAQARPGPDGALYIVDMYRFLIEHPRWIPAGRLAQIDIRAGADKGRIYRVVKEGQALRPVRDLTQLKGAELAAALDSPNGIERDRVHVELLTRKEKSAAPALKKLAETASLPSVRVQALSALEAVGGLEPAQVKTALRDGDENVRVHALRVSEPWLRQKSREADDLLKAVAALKDDASILVLRQLAFTLGESAAAEAGRTLADMAVKWLANVELRAAVLSSAGPHCGEILERLLREPEDRPGRAEWIAPLVATAAHSTDKALVVRAARAMLPQEGNVPSAANLSALAGLLDALEQREMSGVLNSGPDQKRLERLLVFARQTAADAAGASTPRLAAISLLGGGKDDVRLLCQLAGDPNGEIRRAATARLRRSRSPDVAENILRQWPQLSPGVRAELIALMLGREDWTVALLQAAKGGTVRPAEFSLSDRQRLSGSDNSKIQQLSREIFPQASASSGREEIIAGYKTALARSGNVAKGVEVFEQSCASCHILNGVGQEVGPDLAALRSKEAEYWLKNILDPNAVVEPRFVTYEIELKDERSLSGIIKTETATSLTVVSGSGVSETISRTDIRDIRASTLSLMPEGLEQTISPEQMADLIAYIKSGNPRKTFAGNIPGTVSPGRDGVLLLPAAKAEFYGGDIAFESPFNNAGMWHGQDDHLVWTAEITNAGVYDVYIDYACASSSPGNKFLLKVADKSVGGAVNATGPDWSEYRQIQIGQMELAAGKQRVVFRPDENLRGALIDLRTVAFAPPGVKPRWPSVVAPDPEVMRDPATVARFILDPKKPDAAREAAIQANPQFAAALITEMTRDLPPGASDEYARIPWIWRVAIACGKRNDAAQIKAMLEASLPRESEPLRDWQSVVIGGGIINGLSQRKIAPNERILQIIGSDQELRARWQRSLELASEMTDNEKVPMGTRYDALRMIAMEPWQKRGDQLLRYLGKGVHPELQMGAVSGAGDMPEPEATAALIGALPHLTAGNRELALEALRASEPRKRALQEAVKAGKVDAAIVGGR